MKRWQDELSRSFTDPKELLSFLEIAEADDVSVEAAQQFSFRVTRSYASKMRKRDPHDPLLRQVLPSALELPAAPGYVEDPVADREAAAVPGVLHKYRGRALLLCTGACAIQCRYCFRRNFPYQDFQLTRSAEAEALAYIAGDSSLSEVILSGGDPLLLSDDRLRQLVHSLADVPHVRRVRIHSRLPVVLPERITPDLLTSLTSTRLPIVIVIHANHPNEWDAGVADALSRLRQFGITLLNQAVLLRGINDGLATLAALSEQFFGAGVLPYYLHVLDRARGTAHFEVPERRARLLHRELRRLLPGYLVPRLVREDPGQPCKTLL